MRHIATKFFTSTILAASVQMAQAQDLSYVGIIGQSTTGNQAGNPEGDGSAFGVPDGDGSAFGVEAGVVYELNNVSRIAVEGQYLDWSTDDDDGPGNLFDEEPGTEASIAIHYLRDAGANLTYGGFLMIGSSVSDEDYAGDNTYEHYAVGIEVTYRINSQFLTYGQLGITDTVDSDLVDDSSGYLGGEFVRLGGAYTGFENTHLFLDVQIGRSDEYEDENEPGEFQRIALGGETRFGADLNWGVTYEIAKAEYNAVGDSNLIDVTTIGLGMRYYFGGSSAGDMMDVGAIGTPDIISRANLWTSSLD